MLTFYSVTILRSVTKNEQRVNLIQMKVAYFLLHNVSNKH